LLLSLYHPRYVNPIRSWADRLRVASVDVTEASHDTWYAEDVLDALETPRDLVVYFGHGVPGAWKGFGHVDATDIAAVDCGGSHRLVASLNCHALSAPSGSDGGGGTSISDAFLDTEIAEAVVGHEGEVRYEDNRATLDRLLSTYLDAVRTDRDPVVALRERAKEGAVSVVCPDDVPIDRATV
jgi:hypothetical protein